MSGILLWPEAAIKAHSYFKKRCTYWLRDALTLSEVYENAKDGSTEMLTTPASQFSENLLAKIGLEKTFYASGENDGN